MDKQIHTEKQGSDEWLALRMTKRPASLAAAVMGLSPYMTRNEVLRVYATGIPTEIDSFVEKFVFAEGHRVEPLARGIIENTIGEDLSPVVYSKGLLSASTDGINFAETIGFECKQWNEGLANLVRDGIVPDSHMPQAQQCLFVTEAEEWYFTVSDGTEDKTVFTVVKPSQEWFDRINSAWAQFESDLANYAPVIHDDKPLHDAVKELPALFVHAYGEITTNNMEYYGNALSERLKEVRSIVLVEDKDFANANKAAKDFRYQIEKLRSVKESMLEQTTSIGEAARMIDEWCEDLRVTALQLEKDVKREDAKKKDVIVGSAKFSFDEYLIALDKELSPFHLTIVKPNFAEAIAKKRDYNSMQNAVDTMLANAKIDADAVAKDAREKLAYFNEAAIDYKFLFNDIQQMIGFEKSHFEMAVRVRIDTHKKSEADKVEVQRIQIQAEEEAKARKKAEAEQAAKLEEEREVIREEERVKAEEQGRADRAEKAELDRLESARKAKEREDEFNRTVFDEVEPQQNAELVAELTEDIKLMPPARFAIIAAISNEFNVSRALAEQWLIAEFSRTEERA